MLYGLLVRYRALQVAAHHYHNICSQATFMPDHEQFAAVYEKAEAHYDDIMERMIGLGNPAPSLHELISDVAASVESVVESSDNAEYFSALEVRVMAILDEIERIVDEEPISEGTLQLIGGQADEWEKMMYKIKQRLK